MRKIILVLFLFCYNLGAQEYLSLEDCRQMALSNSYSSKEAKLNIEAAKYQRTEALAEYFPRLSFQTLGFRSYKPLIEIGIDEFLHGDLLDMAYSWTFENGVKNKYSFPKYGYNSSLLLVQPVFTGLRIVKGNQLAELGVKAAELQGRVSERKTIEEIDEYFWLTVSLEDKLGTISTFQTLLDSLYKDVSVALASGLVTEDEYLQVHIKRNELRAAELKLKNGIKLSKINLLNNIGYRYEFLKLDSIDVVYNDNSLDAPLNYYKDENEIASKLEELALLELQIKAKELQRDMEFGQTLPQIIVGASYGYTKIGDRDKWNGLAFASLSIPISDWWKNSVKNKRFQTEVEKAKAQKEYLSQQLILLVRKTWVELCGAWDDYQITVETYSAANQSFMRQNVQYKAGLITTSTLLQSQANLQQISSNLGDSRIAYLKALSRWKDLLR